MFPKWEKTEDLSDDAQIAFLFPETDLVQMILIALPFMATDIEDVL